MVTIGSLWLAVLISAVLVWIASAVVWTVLPHHKKDYAVTPDEEAARQALSGISAGTYSIPHATSMESFKDPEFITKMIEGPVGFLTIVSNGTPAMGKKLAMSFGFYIFVGFTVAYLASRSLAPGAEYMFVFQVTSTIAWAAYGFAIIQDGIWFGRPFSHVWKHLFDAFLYGILTGGVFGWLWP